MAVYYTANITSLVAVGGSNEVFDQAGAAARHVVRQNPSLLDVDGAADVRVSRLKKMYGVHTMD